MTARLRASLLLGFLLVAGTLAIELNRPPVPVPASAPAGEFSAYRALEHLKRFARKPHPMGTPEHTHARDYLVEQLGALGLNPEIQRATGVTEKFNAAGNVENIVARLPGWRPSTDSPRSPGALLLAAHYDSVPAAPGNGDDGAGVAAILETLRALRTQQQLQNDTIILFSDGEEDGLLGASAFMAEHPWAKDVRLALNFEGRGNAGISQMFETSAGNGRLIREFADTAPQPFGSSLTYEIYKRMPNDTDMTVFKQHGSAGLNFAFIGHCEAYHAPIDTPENLDLRSLQHHGEYALSLARHFGNADLNSLREPDAVYFSVFGGHFVHYSSLWVWPLAVAGVVILALLLVKHLHAQHGDGALKKFLLAVLALILLAIAVGAGSFGLAAFFLWLHRGWLPDGPVSQSVPYWLSLLALIAALCTAACLWLRKRLGGSNVALAAAFVVLALALAAAKWLPGASYVFFWPLFGALAGVSSSPRDGDVPLSLGRYLTLFVVALPALGILSPMPRAFLEVVGLFPAGAAMIGVVFALLLTSLAPQLDMILSGLGGRLPVGALAIGLVCFGWGALATRHSAARPKASILYYALNADFSRALWASSARRNDSWTAQFVGSSPTRGKLPEFMPEWFPIDLLKNDAPAVPLAPPEATLVTQSNEGDSRSLTLHIRSARFARSLSIRIPDSIVLESSVNGRSLPKPVPMRWNPGGKWNLSFANLPPDGIELKFRVQGSGPVKLDVVDWSLGLPEIPGKHFDPRPPEMMMVHTGDQTLVRRTFVF